MINEHDWQIELAGIGDYVCLPSPIKIKWVGHGSPGFMGDSIDTKTTQINIPRTLSESVFRATNNLLADLDVGLDAERRKDEEVSFDYSDLI
jgi:hypothetical protein